MARVPPLPRRTARTFYNAVDALRPPGPGAGAVDLAPALAERFARWGALRRAGFVAGLAALEAAPRLALRGGFSWLPRGERARRLARLEQSRLPPVGAAARGLRRLVDELLGEAQSRAGA
jgi:hypothetical protein